MKRTKAAAPAGGFRLTGPLVAVLILSGTPPRAQTSAGDEPGPIPLPAVVPSAGVPADAGYPDARAVRVARRFRDHFESPSSRPPGTIKPAPAGLTPTLAASRLSKPWPVPGYWTGGGGPEARPRLALHPVGTPRELRPPDRKAGSGPKALQMALGNAGQGRRDDDTVRAFLWNYRPHLRLNNPDDELQLVRKARDSLGRRHFRYVQRFRGLPVWPAELIVHLDPDGHVDLMNGSHVPTPQKIPFEPVVAAEAAWVRARAAASSGTEANARSTALIVYARPDRPARLAWKLELDISPDAQWLAVVDAVNGQVLAAYNTVEPAAARGSGTDLLGQPQALDLWQEDGRFWLVDTSKPMFDATSDPPNRARGAIQVLDARNRPATNDPEGLPLPDLVPVASARANAGWLPDAVSAAINFSLAYDYFRQLGRNSIDNQGGTLRAVVRLAKGYPNAFWSSSNNTMFFGDAEPYAGALDVVAHELTHGITEHSARLEYVGQSGALNEAFSDIFGEMVEAYAFSGNDWIIGSRLGSPIRNLKNPAALNTPYGRPYPAKMTEYFNIAEDNGGVHINSSIVNHAFYLLAVGLPRAIGRAPAERIFFRALTVHLTAGAQFVDARLACIRAAEELFGAGSEQAAQTAAAFDAVEIVDRPSSPAAAPTPPAAGDDAVAFARFVPEAGVHRLFRRETGRGDSAAGTPLNTLPINLAVRPSVSADGRKVLFVDAFNDICTMSTTGTQAESCLGFDFVHSATLSPDGRHLAYLILDRNRNLVKKIFYYNAETDRLQSFDLVAPATEHATTDSIRMADAMEISRDNRYLVFDALNLLTLDDGTELGAWSLYAFDLLTGNRLVVVPPKPGYDIVYPALGKSSRSLIVYNATRQGTTASTLYAGNLGTGEFSEIATVPGALAVPAFTSDDSAVVYDVPDPATATRYSLWRVPLRTNPLAAAGPPVPWLSDAVLGTPYRRGALSYVRVRKQGPGRGTVTSDREGIECGVLCSALFPPGTPLVLTPHAHYGSAFAGWRGACRGREPCTLTIGRRPVTVRARFKKIPVVTLRIRLDLESGAGRVVSLPVGIDCGTRCRARYLKGTRITLNAVPDPGSAFAGWSGACRGQVECTVDLRKNLKVTAHFAAPGTAAP
jgi:bacillolysin